MSENDAQIEAVLDHLLAGGDAPPHADSKLPLVQKLHALARERIDVREGTRAFSYLATISHELRTPLNAVIGYSELLLEEEDHYDPKALKADVKRIHDAGKHLLGLVNEVVEVARIESGHTQLQRRMVGIQPLVQELLPTLMEAVRRKGNKFTWEVDQEIRLFTDPAKLRTVLRTLVNRAARVTSNGEIVLRATPGAGDDLVIEVEDTGDRVSTEDLARTFHPFTGGSGAGLTSTARLVELIGGRLEVEAAALGTRFRVVLPALMGQTEDEEPLPVVPLGKRVVLVVNRDRAMRDLLERTLSKLDCVVVTASSSAEAVRIAKGIKPTVVAMEANRDDVDGWDTLATFKSIPQLAAIPVVMLSGEAEETLHADDFISKPFDRTTMLDTIARILEGGGRRRVLVVDDEADARELARRVLTSAGYLVDEVADGLAALDYLANEVPDLILLDLMMPEMDGFQMLQELRKNDTLAKIPVVVLTAMSLNDNDRELLRTRTQSIVTKGTTPSALLERVARVLAVTGA